MKLTTTTQISVDGVMQGPGAPVAGVAERGAFERSGWAHFDNEAGAVMDEIFGRADAFLFGRRTYEIFAASWGTWDDPGDSPIWTALHTLPKYVALTTPFDPKWANTTVLSGDIAAAIRALKAKAGGEFQVQGSGALFRWLLDNDLVDEMNLFTFPVVVGQGRGCSRTPARTGRSTWSTRDPPARGSRSRSTGRSGARSTERPVPTRTPRPHGRERDGQPHVRRGILPPTMTRYLVLLRGINVGGRNKVPMAALRELLESHGHTNVSTYIASGNVILSSNRSAAAIKRELEEALPKTFELDSELIAVLVLTRAQLRDVVRERPKGFGDQPDTYHSDAIFLMEIDASSAMKVFDPRPGVDEVWPGKGVIYSQRLSAQRTKSRLSKIMGTPAYRSMTIRSWATTMALLERMEAPEAGA